MRSKDIEDMLAEKGKPCISIIIPTKRFGHERQQNHELLEKAITRSQILVKHSSWSKEQINQLTEKLNTLQSRIEQLRLAEGLAIFISPEIFKIYSLPFSITEKVMLGDSFEIRDLIYLNQFLRPYYLVAVSRHRVRLFRGTGRDLQEIINSDFPKKYVEEYEYSRPSIASSSSAGLKSFERDKSVLSDTRVRTFFKQADEVLGKYVKSQTPLFIAGVDEEITDFVKVSSHTRQIRGKIRGNYDVDAVHPLAETTWNKIKREVQVSNRELRLKLDDAVGRHMAVDGLFNVWKAARAGQGHILLVEKDYVQRAYTLNGSREQLFPEPPIGKYEVIHDAVDDVIEIVKGKGGDVAILENGELNDFQRIALILRYAS